MGILDDEDEAINRILRDADVYGYGNLISHLKKRWAEKLVESGLTLKTAIMAADVDNPLKHKKVKT